ncbi:uncharacterized protein N7458_005670 [Penicillium daleae]|uniref:Dynactin subunit 6 n=1 Tax=Penicillium daleae TaxID=63821 RepID=A0AAD6CAU2_9EURO|nr:uncharacterized protein N7458_005670 [Penicillium daleae]KAJ5454714.1 hypothetical protein N7458_005670 [Penicillium daleae]
MATLKPPPAQHRSSSSSHTPTGPPKAPLKADPSATIADTAVFQGTYPVTIGAGTVIHPRARFYAFEGPISVGDGCIISEKAIIGAAPGTLASTRPSPSSSTGPSPTGPSPASSSTDLSLSSPQIQGQPQDLATRISYFVTIGPHSTVLPGANVHSSATIESLVTINRYADIGAHSKICSGCQIPPTGPSLNGRSYGGLELDNGESEAVLRWSLRRRLWLRRRLRSYLCPRQLRKGRSSRMRG